MPCIYMPSQSVNIFYLLFSYFLLFFLFSPCIFSKRSVHLTPIANRTIFLLSAEDAALARLKRSLDCPSVMTIKTFFTFGLDPLFGEKTLSLSKERQLSEHFLLKSWELWYIIAIMVLTQLFGWLQLCKSLHLIEKFHQCQIPNFQSYENHQSNNVFWDYMSTGQWQTAKRIRNIYQTVKLS